MGKYTKACVQPLWVPPDRGLFPVALGLYIFALVNLSHGYNLLLSLVSSFSKSAKLRGGWPSDSQDIKRPVQWQANSTHSIYASYGV